MQGENFRIKQTARKAFRTSCLSKLMDFHPLLRQTPPHTHLLMLSLLHKPPTDLFSSFLAGLPKHTSYPPPAGTASTFISLQPPHQVEPSSQAGSLKGSAAPLLGPGVAKKCFTLGQARCQYQKHPNVFCLVALERWEFSAALGRTGSITELLAMQTAFCIPVFSCFICSLKIQHAAFHIFLLLEGKDSFIFMYIFWLFSPITF